MTTTIILGTLLAIAVALVLWLAVKIIDLEQELSDSEHDADTYSMELACKKTEIERAKTEIDRITKEKTHLASLFADTLAERDEARDMLKDEIEKHRASCRNYNALSKFKAYAKCGEIGKFAALVSDEDSVVSVVKYFNCEDCIVIKSFPYSDTEERVYAWIEAQDLIDALNGKIGWRINEQGNP